MNISSWEMFFSISPAAFTKLAARASEPASPIGIFVLNIVISPLAQLALDRGDAGFGAGLFARHAAIGARDSNRADHITVDDDGNAAAQGNDVGERALAVKVVAG